MNSLILSYSHYQGWGDSVVSIISLLNAAQQIKINYSNIKIGFIINDIYSNNLLELLETVLDIHFFKNYFDFFEIINLGSNLNNIIKNDTTYKRIYSARNFNLLSGVPGTFDVYCDSDLDSNTHKNITDLCEYCTFNNDHEPENKNIQNFSIFHNNILNFVDNFILTNLNINFNSICYRENNIFNLQKINNFLNNMDKYDSYLVTSNSSRIKKIIHSQLPNAQMIRGYEEEHELDGMPVGDSRLKDAFYSVCELYALSKSQAIFYAGEMTWISLFVWYARNVCKVSLIDINRNN
jgi:hypothetical protein